MEKTIRKMKYAKMYVVYLYDCMSACKSVCLMDPGGVHIFCVTLTLKNLDTLVL